MFNLNLHARITWCRYNIRIKRCSVRLYIQLFVGELMSYLRYLYLLVHSGVQHILCCIFLLLFFVFCIQCCQFLWIVHLLLSLLYFLTFIVIKSSISVLNFHITVVCYIWYQITTCSIRNTRLFYRFVKNLQYLSVDVCIVLVTLKLHKCCIQICLLYKEQLYLISKCFWLPITEISDT